MPSDGDAIACIVGHFCVNDATDTLCLSWHRLWGRVTPNDDGVTGWATVVRSLHGTVADGTIARTVPYAMPLYSYVYDGVSKHCMYVICV